MNGKKCIGLSVLVLVGVAGAPAAANNVWINNPNVIVGSSTTVSNQTFRIAGDPGSNLATRWDQSIGEGSSVAGAGAVNIDIGTVSELNNQLLDFTIRNFTAANPGPNGELGLHFGIVGPNNSGTVSWGTGFSGDTATTLGGKSVGDLVYNSLLVRVNVDGSGNSLDVTNLNFTANPAATTFGSFFDPTSSIGGQINQRLVADFDLASNDWTLTGTLKGFNAFPATPNDLRFRVFQEQTAFVVIPLPTGAGLAGLGLGLVALRRRR
ncbi:MAG: hypothetical protein JJU33_04360 [Phycisphaerales bacterium]|nr:hypothetical protein [Phycisphaerales bacterium]